MRISDWSSDVCSSDLRVRSAFRDHKPLKGYEVDQVARDVIDRAGKGEYFCHRTGHSIGQERSEERREGKSVSVRVDLGGRRIIQKKKKMQKTMQPTNRENYE